MENRTMMKLVIGTEAMLFLSLIMAFLYMAYNGGFEPHEVNELHPRIAALFTASLLASSGTLWISERQYHKGATAAMKLWMAITIVLGAIFLAGQAHEYLQLLKRDITLSGSVFGTSFYTLTGFHGLHVIIGLFVLGIVLWIHPGGNNENPAPPRNGPIGVAAMYWHFVDIVWLVVFSVIYLLPHFINVKK